MCMWHDTSLMSGDVLMVAEKPSMAASIAGFLSGGTHTTRHEQGGVTHDFRGSFHGRSCGMRVTAVKGHVYNLDVSQPATRTRPSRATRTRPSLAVGLA